MDAFNYLAVLLSIIIGLGLTQVLSATGRLIRGREQRASVLAAVVVGRDPDRDLRAGVDERGVDLHEYYARHAPWFFGFFAATLIVSVVKEVVLEGRLPERANLAFHAVLFSAALAGALVRRPSVHRAIAIVCALGISAYIALLFARLR